MSSSPSATVSSLRSHLLNTLSGLPGSRTFHLHVLVSTPRKPGQSLFLYADTRPKCFVQDVLILLSEETTEPVESAVSSGDSSFLEVSALTPRVFVSAIEASVYAFPASGSTVLYISKVDGTGQGAHPSPTSILLHAFLVFYAAPQSPVYTSRTTHHLWIHLFARSQRQYLFPNSADHPKKKPLGDVALCRWWKKILSDVAKAVEITDDAEVAHDAHPAETRAHVIRLYYILPGQTEPEASYLLRDLQGSSAPSRTPWIYSYPYRVHAEPGIPPPSGDTSEPAAELWETRPVAYLIPHFEDDPKSRFLDELAATSEEQVVAVPVPTPRRKRQKTGNSTQIWDSTLGYEEMDKRLPESGSSLMKDENGARIDVETKHASSRPVPPTIVHIPPSSSPPQADAPSPPLRPSTPEIRETPQNTILSPHTPNLPTFVASSLSPHTPPNVRGRSHSPLVLQTPLPRAPPHTPRTPRRPTSDLDTISSAEFWERMSFRQECALGAVTAFFVAIFSSRGIAPQGGHTDTPPPSSITVSDGTNSSAINDIPSTLLSTGTIPHSVLKRVMSSLLTGVEFSTTERAQKGTHVMECAINGLCQGISGGNAPSGDSAMNNVDVYASHVYASLSTSNPPPFRRSGDTAGATAPIVASAVNVLGVRRKKKKD